MSTRRTVSGAGRHCTRIGVWYVPSTTAPLPGVRLSDTSRSMPRSMRKNRDAPTSSVRASRRSMNRRLQAEFVDEPVQRVHHVVLRVGQRLGRNRARIVPRVPRALGRKPQRIAQHVRQVVVHQPRFVFVDRQAGVLLGRRQFQAHAALGDAVLIDELADLVVEAEPRVLQIDRVDRVRRTPARPASRAPLPLRD